MRLLKKKKKNSTNKTDMTKILGDELVVEESRFQSRQVNLNITMSIRHSVFGLEIDRFEQELLTKLTSMSF